MTQQDKELLLKDLCARLPYKIVILDVPAGHSGKLLRIDNDSVYYDGIEGEEWQTLYNIKPYLRPMSSMTMEEMKERLSAFFTVVNTKIGLTPMLSSLKSIEHIDWLNAHHFDYRGLISKGLAIEVTKENDPYK